MNFEFSRNSERRKDFKQLEQFMQVLLNLQLNSWSADGTILCRFDQNERNGVLNGIPVLLKI